MKTRILVRKHGWVPVEVDRMKLDWTGRWLDKFDKQDVDHYSEILAWCHDTVGPGNFVATLQNGTAHHHVKRFVFKRAEDATLFRLKWLT